MSSNALEAREGYTTKPAIQAILQTDCPPQGGAFLTALNFVNRATLPNIDDWAGDDTHALQVQAPGRQVNNTPPQVGANAGSRRHQVNPGVYLVTLNASLKVNVGSTTTLGIAIISRAMNGGVEFGAWSIDRAVDDNRAWGSTNAENSTTLSALIKTNTTRAIQCVMVQRTSGGGIDLDYCTLTTRRLGDSY